MKKEDQSLMHMKLIVKVKLNPLRWIKTNSKNYSKELNQYNSLTYIFVQASLLTLKKNILSQQTNQVFTSEG